MQIHIKAVQFLILLQNQFAFNPRFHTLEYALSPICNYAFWIQIIHTYHAHTQGGFRGFERTPPHKPRWVPPQMDIRASQLAACPFGPPLGPHRGLGSPPHPRSPGLTNLVPPSPKTNHPTQNPTYGPAYAYAFQCVAIHVSVCVMNGHLCVCMHHVWPSMYPYGSYMAISVSICYMYGHHGTCHVWPVMCLRVSCLQPVFQTKSLSILIINACYRRTSVQEKPEFDPTPWMCLPQTPRSASQVSLIITAWKGVDLATPSSVV